MVFFLIVFFNWKQQVRTQPHIKTLSQLKSKSEPTFDSKKPESQLCLRWMFLFSCLEISVFSDFFDLRIFSTYSWDQWCFPFSWDYYFFSIFSWDWCFFDFPELGIFFSVSFQIGLEINALLEFLEIFFYCFFRLSWYIIVYFLFRLSFFYDFLLFRLNFFRLFLYYCFYDRLWMIALRLCA